MRRVRFSPDARSQLLAIARYLQEQTGDERAGERTIRRIEERLLRTAELTPMLGRPRPELGTEVRSLPHGRYLILLRYTDGTIDVLHVLHGSRDIAAFLRSGS